MLGHAMSIVIDDIFLAAFDVVQFLAHSVLSTIANRALRTHKKNKIMKHVHSKGYTSDWSTTFNSLYFIR